jgi:hypothetical protein
MLRKFGIIAVLSLIVAALAAVPALAQTGGTHFTRGGLPSCTIDLSGSTANVDCSSELAGLGNENLVIQTSATGFVTFQCGSPGNENIAPGQNRLPATFQGTEPTVILGGQIKNGRATATDDVTVVAPSASDVTPAEAGCPNRRWHVIGPGDITLTSVTYTVRQGGQLLATVTWSDASDFSDNTLTFAEANSSSGPAF